MNFGNYGIGQWAFIGGLLLVLLFGFMPDLLGEATTYALLAGVGFLVAIFNIQKGEAVKMIWVGILLGIVGTSTIAAKIGAMFGPLEVVINGLGFYFVGVALWVAVLFGFKMMKK